MIILTLLLSISVAKTNELPAHRLAVSDGGKLSLPQVSFAVVGNTRPTAPFLDKTRSAEGTFADAIIGDVIVTGLTDSLDFVAHTGDMVPTSSQNAWRDFGNQVTGLIDGTTTPKAASKRYPIIPVAGDRDCAKDHTCEAFGQTFPGFGVDIGFGRTATWQAFELEIDGTSHWKLIVLDTNKKGLGSRWNEQLMWLAQQAKEPKDGILLLMHEPAISLIERKEAAHAKELVEHIENNAPLMSIKAIFSAGPSLSQALLPEGAFGIAHFGAGGGGTPAEDLDRGVPGGAVDQQMAPGFNKALDALVSAYETAEEGASQRAIDEAMGRGSFTGFSRRISGQDIPTNGWWKVRVDAQSLSTEWRARQPDGTFRTQARWKWSKDEGWISTQP